MLLEQIKQGKWDICAICNNQGKAILLNDFNKLSDNYKKNVYGIYALFARASGSNTGPSELHHSQCHCINENHKIYEFIHGQIRVLWFQDTVGKFPKNRAVICSHLFLKKTQKTPKAEIEKVIRLKKKYTEASQNNTLKIKG